MLTISGDGRHDKEITTQITMQKTPTMYSNASVCQTI